MIQLSWCVSNKRWLEIVYLESAFILKSTCTNSCASFLWWWHHQLTAASCQSAAKVEASPMKNGKENSAISCHLLWCDHSSRQIWVVDLLCGSVVRYRRLQVGCSHRGGNHCTRTARGCLLVDGVLLWPRKKGLVHPLEVDLALQPNHLSIHSHFLVSFFGYRVFLCLNKGMKCLPAALLCSSSFKMTTGYP